MQITTTMKYHSTAVRMAKILNSENTIYFSCLFYGFLFECVLCTVYLIIFY